MSSQSSKVEVLWSPNRDEEFAVYGTELRLYSVQELEVCGGSEVWREWGRGGRGRGRFLSYEESYYHFTGHQKVKTSSIRFA